MKKLLYIILTIPLLNCEPKGTELVGHIGRPDISPDGEKITFIYAQDASKNPWEIYSSDISGKNVTQLTDFAEARIKKGAVWSPDGKKIAFHADIKNGAQIFSMDSSGKNLTQLTESNGYNVEPHWSPDGEQIIFNSMSEDGKAQIFMMNADGSDIRKLNGPFGDNWYPRITSKNKIIFTSDFNHEAYYDIF